MRNQPLPKTFSPARARALLCAIAISGAMLLSSGCLYRMPIQQGNFLNPTQVAQLETGMTRSQVRFLLGTPMVPNGPSGFDADRWDYYYYVKVGRLWKPQTQRLSVWFKDEKVDHIENSDPAVVPATPGAAAAQTAPATPAPAATP